MNSIIKKISKNWEIITASIFPIVVLYLTWDTLLIDHHGFRQTQTAITSYYIYKYINIYSFITPVLGAPWQIPMEYPLYQIIVYHISNIFVINLDNAGRLVGVFFYYASILILCNFIDIKNKVNNVLYVSIFTSPLMVFFSSRFLIESTALFLSLMALFLFFKLREKININKSILFALFITLGGLQKITTLFPFILCIFLYSLKDLFYSNDNDRIKKFIYINILIVLGLILPLIWIFYTDIYKNSSYILQYLTSKSLSEWNYGNILQRIDLANIFKIFVFRDLILSGLLTIFLLFTVRVLNRENININSLLFIIPALITQLLFFNLFLVHDYYFMSTSILYLIGFHLMYKPEERFKINKRWYLGNATIAFTVNISIFFGWYYPLIGNIPESHIDMYKIAKYLESENVNNKVILTYGLDWDSTIPYYSNNYAIMIPNWSFVKNSPLNNNEKFNPEKITENIESYLMGKKIGGIVLCGNELDALKFIDFANLKYDLNWKITGKCRYSVVYK